MATFDLAFATRIDGVAAVQTFLPTGIQTGDSVTVAGVGNDFNGTQTVISVEPFEFIGTDEYGDLLFDYNIIRENQILWYSAFADYTREVTSGTVAFTPVVTWITSNDVLAWLGIDVATSNDTAFVATCVSAANAWCWRKRREAGYADSMTTVPDGSVKLGAVMYAGTLFRERGSVDSFASFDSMSVTASPSATLGRIMQLLGCGRAQVA